MTCNEARYAAYSASDEGKADFEYAAGMDQDHAEAARIVWDIDGNEWAVVNGVAHLQMSMNSVRADYIAATFFDSYADFVRARIAFEKAA